MSLRHAMVCASNVNRSMAAHELLQKEGLTVESYGVGNTVKMPGASPSTPLRYAFGTPYQEIHDDMIAKNIGQVCNLVEMMARNLKVKQAPERWQDRPLDSPPLDVVVSFESRVFDIVVADLRAREEIAGGCHPCLVVNLEVKDSTTEAANAAPQALLLCQMLEEAEDWESEVDSVLASFAKKTGRKKPQYDVCFV